MKDMILDFSHIDSLWNLHEYLKEAFGLPYYYGHNMDALWDCLHCAFEAPTRITIRNVQKLPANMTEAASILLALFRELESENEKVTVIVEQPAASNDLSDFLI